MASGSYISLALVLIFSMSKARGASSISSSQHLQAIHSMTFRRDQRGVRALRRERLRLRGVVGNALRAREERRGRGAYTCATSEIGAEGFVDWVETDGWRRSGPSQLTCGLAVSVSSAFHPAASVSGDCADFCVRGFRIRRSLTYSCSLLGCSLHNQLAEGFLV
ncbi:hypothetical protein OPV22_021274 [Ensete ventricosum]|uniref:Uncharacterized protein n=1 Tax=Ensete ventricosum TaxID=4639 RepID=A0AAV8QQ87_ENSVE|nr:hypothetical protein OPV22_021274 [Ensete ventricosum]